MSTPGAKFMTMDIKDFYLCTPLARREYAKLRLSDIPDEVITEYGLEELATAEGFVYIVVKKRMYGLPQAGLLAQQQLEKRLNKHGYSQSLLVPGLWTHNWRPIQFSLVVDDFGVKYVGEEHARHLRSVLEADYQVETDRKGKKYVGLTLDWDYERHKVHLLMPGYVSKALK